MLRFVYRTLNFYERVTFIRVNTSTDLKPKTDNIQLSDQRFVSFESRAGIFFLCKASKLLCMVFFLYIFVDVCQYNRGPLV